MDKEALGRMRVPQEIVDARPKDYAENERYWRRYEALAEQMVFDGKLNEGVFAGSGYEISLRDGMTTENIGDAIRIGGANGLFTAEAQFDHMVSELEKVVQFTPTRQ